jgi:Na+/H+ antiporter NhaD/arsenite permease-like protein
MTFLMAFALALFIGIYIVISADLLSKTIIALLGASVFVIAGFVHGDNPWVHVDWNVIILLFSMMIIVGIIKQTGLSQFVAIKAAKLVHGNPVRILVFFVAITALFSALLGTVTTVMLIVPVSILICVELDISPMPFLIAEPMAANIGGCATVVGDATTIMVGSAFNLDFVGYMHTVDPILLILIVVFSGVIVLFFKKDLRVSNERKARIMEFDESKSIEDRPLMWKSLIVMLAVIVGFLTSSIHKQPVSVVALLGASVLMVLAGGKEVDHFFKDVDWGTLFFFVGLFTLVGGVVDMGIIGKLGEFVAKLTGGHVGITSVFIVWVSGVVSALVDNVPYVVTMIPLVTGLAATLRSPRSGYRCCSAPTWAATARSSARRRTWSPRDWPENQATSSIS